MQKNKVDVSIIIISYNTKDMTLSCIESVYNETKNIDYEVIVVDNASSDGSADTIAEIFPDVKLIRSNDNMGFAAANNLAAAKSNGDYILLLNPDTVVLDGAIVTLLTWAKNNPKWGIYGGSTYFEDMKRNPTAGWNRPTAWSLFCSAIGLSSIFRRSILFNPESLSSWSWDMYRRVDIVTGCFMLMKSELWNKLDGFDTQFVMYGEDADICLRSAALGKPCVLVPEAGIIHYGGASEKVRADKMVRLLTAKNQLFRKHMNGFQSDYAILMLKLSVFSRKTVLFTISLFKKSSIGSYDSWRAIWSRRKEWESIKNDFSCNAGS